MSIDPFNISEQATMRVRKLLQDDSSAALAEAARCLEHTPDNLDLRFLKGVAHYRSADHEHAIATLEQVLQSNDAITDVHFQRAL